MKIRRKSNDIVYSHDYNDLTDSTFDHENFHEADFSRMNLQNSVFNCVDLSYADLSHCNLEGCAFLGCNMRGVDMSYANLRGADFQAGDLTEGNLSYTDLTQASFINTRIDKTNLCYTTFNFTDFGYLVLSVGMLGDWHETLVYNVTNDELWEQEWFKPLTLEEYAVLKKEEVIDANIIKAYEKYARIDEELLEEDEEYIKIYYEREEMLQEWEEYSRALDYLSNARQAWLQSLDKE